MSLLKNGNKTQKKGKEMDFRIGNITKMNGTLTALNKSGIVEILSMTIAGMSAKKLAVVLRNNKVTNENQELFFREIIINKNHISLFLTGQQSVIKDGNRYIMNTQGRNPIRFEGNLETVVTGDDGYIYACGIQIGSIEFDLFDKSPRLIDEKAVFTNVSATIFPFGEYRATML